MIELLAGELRGMFLVFWLFLLAAFGLGFAAGWMVFS